MLKRSMIAAALLVCASAAPSEAAKTDNSIRFAYDQVLENIDPYFNNVRLGVIMSHAVWDTLIYRNPNTNEYEPGLATSWKWIDDRTLELELREGVEFHNGEAFDADDVVYTLNFASDPANKATAQQNVSWIEKAEKVDQHTVRITTKGPFPAAIEYLSGPIPMHPNEYYAEVGPRGMNQNPVGTGPYKVVEHDVGKVIRLEANKDYWEGAPKPRPTIEKIEVRMIPDRQTQVAEMLSGGLDMIMNVPVEQAEQLEAAPHLSVTSGLTMRIVFILFNAADNAPNDAIKDVRVRQAIAHSIDKVTMARELVGQDSQVIETVCFPTQFGCTDEGAQRYPYDPEKAKALLAEAGYKDGFDLEFLGYRERPQTEAMVNYMRAVGIRANLTFMQYAAMREQHRANKAAATHQTWGSFSINDASAGPSAFFKGIDDDMTKDPEVIAQFEKGDTSVDPEVRKEAYKRGLQLVNERAHAVPLYALTTYYVADKDLEFTPYPDEIPRFWEMAWK